MPKKLYRQIFFKKMGNYFFALYFRDYVAHEVKDALVRLGGMLPMNIFLRQEIDRMQKILTRGTKQYYIREFRCIQCGKPKVFPTL